MMRNAVSLIALLGAVSKISIAQAKLQEEEPGNSLKSKEFNTPFNPHLKSLHEIVYSNQYDSVDEDDGSFYNPFEADEFTADLKSVEAEDGEEENSEDKQPVEMEAVQEQPKPQEPPQSQEQLQDQSQEQSKPQEQASQENPQILEVEEEEESDAHFGNESNLKLVDLEQGRGCGSVSFSAPGSCSYDSVSSSYYSSDASSDCYSSRSSSRSCSFQPQQPYPLQPAPPCMLPQPQPCGRPAPQPCMIPQPTPPCNGPVLPQPCNRPNPNHFNPLFELPFNNDESEELTFDLSRYSFNFCDAAVYGIVVNLRMIGLRFPRYERTAERTSLKVYFIEMIEKFPCENQRKIIKTILKANPADFSDKKGFNRWAAGFSKKLLKAINFPFGMNLKGMLVPLDAKKKK